MRKDSQAMPSDEAIERANAEGAMPAGATARASGPAVQVVAAILVVATTTSIIVSPYIMSRNAFTALNALMVLLVAAYGIFVAAHSRTTHVALERAYSAHLEELSQRLRTMAYRDALTGLFNHRYFYEQLSHEVDRALRYQQPLTLLLMDMDNFKEINDTYGHMAGDKFLSMVGQAIARQIRSSDIGARYGGDEFVVLLPNTTADEARRTAKKLESAVASSAALTAMDEKLRLGISVGVATCPDDSRAAGDLLQVADARLYDVKAQRPGRHRRASTDAA